MRNSDVEKEKRIQQMIDAMPDSLKQTHVFLSFIEDCRRDRTNEDREMHVRTTPLLEVFSVRIHRNSNHEGPCKIWGLISIINEDDASILHLYDRSRKDIDIVDPNGCISLKGTHDVPFIPFSGYKLRVFLMDDSCNINVANGCFDIVDLSFHDFEKPRVVQVKGEDGYVDIYYTVFEATVLATRLDVKLIRESVEESFFNDPDRICGKIIAKYRDYGFPDFHSSALFENRLNNSEKVELGSPIKLFKSKIGVPAHSSLVIDVDFWDKNVPEECVHGSVEILASDSWVETCEINVGNCLLQFRIDWCHVYEELAGTSTSTELMAQNLKCSNLDEGCSQRTEQLHWPLKKHRSLSYKPPFVDFIITGISPSPAKNNGPTLVEVHSVFVGPNDNGTLRIHGTIKVTYMGESIYIFEKDTSSPEVLSQNKRILSTHGPFQSLQGSYFDIEMNLKDEEGRIISRGKMEWTERSISTHIKWHDRPICSIIRGEQGYYASLYYTIFANGAQCNLNVSFKHNCGYRASYGVWGKIIAHCQNFKDLETYEKESCVSTLFAKPVGDCERFDVDQNNDFNLNLTKAVISTDMELPFKVGMELYVGSPKEGGDVDVITDELQFKPYVNGYKIIDRGDYSIIVTVCWQYTF